MTFDTQQFQQYLTTECLGRSLCWLPEATSTNTILWQQLDADAPEGHTVIAAQQTAGRGQRGRIWQSPVGGLYLSVAIAVDVQASQSHRLTLASGWGIATQLRQHQVPVRLKWPNDLYLQDRKLGGILTETIVQGNRIRQAVVGVGLNWEAASHHRAIALRSAYPDIPIQSLEQLAAVVLNGIEQGQIALRTSGITTISPDYNQWLYQPLPDNITWERL